MEEPSFMLAADSDIDELDMQKVMSKIRRTMKRGFRQKAEDLTGAKRPCVGVDTDVQVQSELTNSVLRCENGNDMGSNSCDSPDQPPAVEATSTSSNVTETSNTSPGGSGYEKEKKKRKLSSRLERILKHRLDKKMEELTDARSEVKPDKKSFQLKIPDPSHKENTTEHTSNKPPIPSPDQYLAVDCEFVGVGFKGCISRLGRCSVVDYHGNVVYDIYSRPEELVTDYRTRYSGISYRNMTDAVRFEEVQEKVKDLLKGKILVGHDIKQDLRVLKIYHPGHMIRDTRTHPSVKKKAKDLGCVSQALKSLTWCLLGRRIQKRTHCSVEDATATMDLFKLVRVEWEESIDQRNSDVNDKSGIKTQDPKDERSEKDSELSEYLDDKFWPEDHEVKDKLSDSSNDSAHTKVLPDCAEPTELNSVAALNEVAQKLRWEVPEYQYECLSSEDPPKFVCTVLVNDEGYQSTSCSNKKEAKADAAKAFFVHHRRSESETYMDVLKHITSNTETEKQTDLMLNPVIALNEVIQRLRWEVPEYQYECLSSEDPPKFVCTVLVNDEGYQSTSCSNKKEAKADAAKAFFVHHRRSESETYMDVLKHITSNTETENQTDPTFKT
ncbi:uncharacterized protein LOC110452349 [Mizuhopecten yessoensis]|uniref:uncharacterized protein LOC110452349 n=1 Tax=Mizuhopecten yessoensis TaxID=6573 RepID=UPI000B45C669|nr:uncharacterized protein LOC110452349 [Mizuhopecten yessoensis]